VSPAVYDVARLSTLAVRLVRIESNFPLMNANMSVSRLVLRMSDLYDRVFYLRHDSALSGTLAKTSRQLLLFLFEDSAPDLIPTLF